ncbi:MAG: YrhK family protein [Pseudomonadota bacterium]
MRFDPRLFHASPRHADIYGAYERIYTVIDLVAALCFVAGSVLFFFEATLTLGTWLFLVGSLCFAAKPAARFAREYHLGSLPLPGDDTRE